MIQCLHLVYHAESLTIPMKLQSFVDIAATVQRLKNIVFEILSAHDRSGCDTVPMCHGPRCSKLSGLTNVVLACWVM